MAMGGNNGNGNKVGSSDVDGNSDCNGNGHGKGDNDKGRVASSCAGNVQRCGRGDALSPPPWTQRKVHSPALHHGGDTAKSVCSLSRGGGGTCQLTIDSFFVYYLQLLFSLLNNPLFTPPCIIQALKNPVSPLTLYPLHSSKNPVSLLTIYPSSYCTFGQGKPGQGLE
jgi:hypothetical protein